MAEEISTFQKFFRDAVLAVDEVESLIADKLFNTFVPPGTPFPYGVFKIVPLGDGVGQARQSYQKNLLVDLKFVSSLPVPAGVPAARKAVEEYFRTSLSFVTDGYRISIRHDRPIEIPEIGRTPDERLLHIGSTYRAWIHGVE